MNPLVLSSLISGGSSLFSGLLGRRKPKAQGIDYRKLRDDAQAAGFNPLTALLAGGGAGYQREFNPELASGAFVAEALGRGLDTYFNTPSAADKESERIRAEFEAETRNQIRLDNSVPRQFGYALTQQRPFSAEQREFAPPLAAVEHDLNGSIIAGGREFRRSGWFSPAEEAEKYYGDVGGTLFGSAALAADVAYNVSPRLVTSQRSNGDNVVLYRSPVGPIYLPPSVAWAAERRGTMPRKPQKPKWRQGFTPPVLGISLPYRVRPR